MKSNLAAAVATLLLALQAASAAGPRDRVSVVGSATLFPLASVVGETFGHRGRWKTPTVESTGTGQGFRLFCRGIGPETPDVTDASRPMSAEERAACARNKVGDVTELKVGMDGILIANGRSAARFELTREQLYRALARELPLQGRLVPNPNRRWRDVDPRLPDLPILVYGPAPNHGTRDAFVALALRPVCERQAELRALDEGRRRLACESLREDGAWVDVTGDYSVLLARLVAEPRAVGVLGYGFLDRNRDRVQAARIDGVLPTLDAIVSGSYPLSRPLFLYVKSQHLGRVPGLAEFLGEFLSDAASGPEGYLVDAGLVPQPQAALVAERRKIAAITRP
jgi:phosphate transport system substrate-binding protein